MGTYRKRFIIIIVLALIAVGGSCWIFASKHAGVDSEFIDGDAVTTESAHGKGKKSKTGEAIVYVTGAVGQPGMYTVQGSLRATELIALAGGLLPDADVSKVNMAQIVKDGMHINIPFIKEKTSSAAHGTRQNVRRQNSLTPPVSINTATAEELAGVRGISPQQAAAIVAYRSMHGPFDSLEDLLKIQGFTPKRVNKLQDKIGL